MYAVRFFRFLKQQRIKAPAATPRAAAEPIAMPAMAPVLNLLPLLLPEPPELFEPLELLPPLAAVEVAIVPVFPVDVSADFPPVDAVVTVAIVEVVCAFVAVEVAGGLLPAAGLMVACKLCCSHCCKLYTIGVLEWAQFADSTL